LEGWSRGDFFQRSKPPFRAGISRWKKNHPNTGIPDHDGYQIYQETINEWPKLCFLMGGI
jgi:hypothetical protein